MASTIRSHSAEAVVRAMANVAAGPIKVPRHVKLRRQDKPFWEGIVRARARDEWTAPELVVAAQLARCQRDIETEQAQLEVEGSMLKNERGTRHANPRFAILEQLARREMALMRSLRMTGRIAGDSRDAAGMRELERRAEKTQQEVAEEGDGLLA